MNQYTISKNEGKISLEEFRKALLVVPGLEEAGEYYVYGLFTALPERCTGEGQVFFVGEGNTLGELSLDIEYGRISVENSSLEICKKLCMELKAGVRPVYYHGSNAPLPDFIYDYNIIE